MEMISPINSKRRRWLKLGAATGSAYASAAWALHVKATPVFPQKPITLIVPWPAGGATDLTMRLLAELAGKQLGQPILVENRAGAGGTMAMPALLNAPGDGYLLAQLPQTIFRLPYTTKVLWDPIRDVTPIIQISGVTFGIVVPTNSPFQSLDDLFAFARKHPNQLTIGSNGVGTTPHVVMEELFEKQGLKYIHVPYKGTAEQMFAVAGGHIMVGVNSNGFAPYVDSGKLRLLVTFGEQRTKKWSHVPTLKELGHGIVASSPYGIGGPKGIPSEVVRTLHGAFKAATFHPAHIAEVNKYDQEINYLASEDYAKASREVYAREKLLVERLGLAKSN